MSNANADQYAEGWKSMKAKAVDLANAYGKPVRIYREINGNHLGGFKMYVEGDPQGLPDDAYYLETVKPAAAL